MWIIRPPQILVDLLKVLVRISNSLAVIAHSVEKDEKDIPKAQEQTSLRRRQSWAAKRKKLERKKRKEADARIIETRED